MLITTGIALALALLVAGMVVRVALVRKGRRASAGSRSPSIASSQDSPASISSATLPPYSIAPLSFNPTELPPVEPRTKSNVLGSFFAAIAKEFRAPSPPDFGDPNDPATLERRQQYNLEIQRALIDAGLMLPPRRSQPRSERRPSGMSEHSASAVEAAEAAPTPGSWPGRAWKWLVGSADLEHSRRTLDEQLAESIERQRVLENERAARHARRERRREREEARLVEEAIALGLPVYSREKSEGEQVLIVAKIGEPGSSSSDEGVHRLHSLALEQRV